MSRPVVFILAGVVNGAGRRSIGGHLLAQPGDPIPDPLAVLEMQQGRLLWPTAPADFQQTPDLGKTLGRGRAGHAP